MHFYIHTSNIININKYYYNFRAGNKGFAYTLISLDQERCAGDLIRALDTSNVTVPEPLKTMWLRYQAKQAAVSSIILTIIYS